MTSCSSAVPSSSSSSPITSLILSHKRIVSLTAETLAPLLPPDSLLIHQLLSSVESIDLSHNKLTEWPSLLALAFPAADQHPLVRSSPLKSLDLSSNLIGTLKGLSKMLSNNKNEDNQLPDRSASLPVESLSISHNRFNQLPPELSVFGSHLRSLSAGHNGIRSLSPSLFASLPLLTSLSLPMASLKEWPSLEVFSQLQGLACLSLPHNHFSSIGPSIGLLTALQELHLSACKISDISPEIRHCTSLRELTLSRNPALSSLCEEFGTLPSLQKLNLSQCHITNTFSSSSLPTSLLSLDLDGNKISVDKLPELLHRLPLLQQLKLSAAPLGLSPSASNDSITPGLKLVHAELRRLDLSSSSLRDASSIVWASDIPLQYINLSNNALTALPPLSLFPSSLAFFSCLQAIDLSRNSFGPEFPSVLANNVPQLKSLNLSFNSIAVLPEADQWNLPSLETLFLNNNHISCLPSEPEKWIQSLPRLKMLRLCNNGLDRATVPALSARINALLSSASASSSGADAPASSSSLSHSTLVEIVDETIRPSEIVPDFLWLGCFECASNRSLLQSLGITHILTVLPWQPKFPAIFNYMVVSVEDVVSQDISSHFDSVLQFFEQVENHPEGKGRVLVHCRMGISRSASMVILYLMMKHKWNYATAHKFVKDKRSIIVPNRGFAAQLKKWAVDNGLEPAKEIEDGGSERHELEQELLK